MARLRLLLSFVILATGGTAALFACGGDDDGAAPSTPASDAAVVEHDAAVTPAATTPVAADVTVYYGSAVTLDASKSTGTDFIWTVTSVPAGSAVTTASLNGATSATPSFQPDAVGTYVLGVSAGGGTASVAVHVVDPSAFFVRLDLDGGSTLTESFGAVGAIAGDGGSRLACFEEATQGNILQNFVSTAQVLTDIWDAPAGQPGRVVSVVETHEDGGAHTSVVATTAASSCAAAATILDETDGVFESAVQFLQPAFSPSGARVAYLRKDANGVTLVTTAFGGGTRREVTTVAATNANVLSRPFWTDEATLVWATQTTNGWQVSTISDAAGANAPVLMTCTGNVPPRIAVLPTGEVLATQNIGTELSLVAYTPDAATKACGAPRDISQLAPSSRGRAIDFALSPDRQRIAYTQRPTNKSPTAELRVLSLDGGVVGTAPNVLVLGPRWIGGGGYLSFTSSLDAGAFAISVVQPDGGDLHTVTEPTSLSGGTRFLSLSVGNGDNAN